MLWNVRFALAAFYRLAQQSLSELCEVRLSVDSEHSRGGTVHKLNGSTRIRRDYALFERLEYSVANLVHG